MVQKDDTLSGNNISSDLFDNPNLEREFEFDIPHVNQYLNDFYVFDRSLIYHTLISEGSECRQNLDDDQYKALLTSTQQQNQVCTSTLDNLGFMNDNTNLKGCSPGAYSSGDNLSTFSEVGTNTPQNSGIGCSKEEKSVSGSGPSTPSFVSPSPGPVPSTPSSVNQPSNVAISCHRSYDQVSKTNNRKKHFIHKLGDKEQKHDYSIEHYSSNDIQPLPSECNGDEALSSESKGTQSELPVEVNEKKHEVNYQLIETGMEFSSEEEAYTFYSNYAAEMGFRVRKGKVQRLQDKTIKKRYFFCSKEGRRLEKQSDNTTKYKRKETRTGCKAMILLTVENGKWLVSNVILEHNHDLKNPSQRDMVDSLTEISEAHSIHTINEVGIAKEAGAAKCAGLPSDNSTSPATRGGQSPARKRARGTRQVQAPIPLGVVPLPEEEEDSIPLSSLWKHRIPTFNVLTTSGDTRVSVEEEASSVDSGYQTPVPEKDTTHVGGQDTTSPLLTIEGPPHEGVQPETLVQDTIEPQQIVQTANPASSSTSREQKDDQSIDILLPPEQTPLSEAPFVITETSGSVQRFSDFTSLSANMKELTRGLVSMIAERIQPPPPSTLEASGLPAIPTLADITAAVEVLRASLDKSATEIFSSPENVASFKQAISLLLSHHYSLSYEVALRNFLTRLPDFEKKIPLFVHNKERAASTRDDSSLKASELLKTLSQQQTCITGLQDSLDELSQRYEAVIEQIRKLEEERTQIQASISSTTAKLSEIQQQASKDCQLLDASKQKVLLSGQDLAAAEDGLVLFEFEWNTLKRRLFPPPSN